jgi:CRISPR/Cas system-associated endonuclease Cas1
VQFGKPSLVCDFQELYRYLIDDFVIQYCLNLAKRDFTFKPEKMASQKLGKREYLNDAKTRDFIAKLNSYFGTVVEIPRIKGGERQIIETLINEEALLFAKYFRDEKSEWLPRIRVIELNFTT